MSKQLQTIKMLALELSLIMLVIQLFQSVYPSDKSNK